MVIFTCLRSCVNAHLPDLERAFYCEGIEPGIPKAGSFFRHIFCMLRRLGFCLAISPSACWLFLLTEKRYSKIWLSLRNEADERG